MLPNEGAIPDADHQPKSFVHGNIEGFVPYEDERDFMSK
jgi:hypothetical protein